MPYPLISSLRPFIIIALVFIVLLVSCEKEVHINLGTSPTQIVVQGAVETGQAPYVFLTSTVGFFSKVDLSTLQNSFIHGAHITVNNGKKTITLREYSFDTGASAKFYIYTIDTANLINNFMLGEEGSYYTLNIVYNGKTYTSVTKVPYPKGVDTMWFDKPLFASSKTPKNALQLFANYTDPDTIGNYVRYFTQRNNKQFYPTGIFTDEVVNGKKVPNIALFGGYDDSTNAKGDSLRYFYPGDYVTLKWCEIDKQVYDFWNSYEFARGAVGNPFASPINLRTNLSNGALGVWAGYGVVLKTLVVPR